MKRLSLVLQQRQNLLPDNLGLRRPEIRMVLEEDIDENVEDCLLGS
jgi:hypothetical protein